MAARHTQAEVPYTYESCGVFDVRQVRSTPVPLTAVPFFVSYTRTISVIVGEIKCPHDVLMQTVTVLAGGGQRVVRFIAGQFPYILEERVTDSRCFMSYV